MKRIKALLLIMVLTLTCVAFTACSSNPKSLKGEEVNRLQWLEAFEYISNGVSGDNSAASFTFSGTVKQYKEATDDNDEKELSLLMNFTMQVNKNIVYLEASMSNIYEDETFEEKGYIYVDNTGKEEILYTSYDKVKWREEALSSVGIDTITNSVSLLKNQQFKFNKKTNMYELFSTSTGYQRIKFNNKKIVYLETKTNTTESECFFTDYGKTEIKVQKPEVEKNKLEIAYNAVMKSNEFQSKSSITLSEDGSYMNFIYKSNYNDKDFEILNNALGLPNGAVVAAMSETTIFNERETAKENGIIVSWIKTNESSYGGIYNVTYIIEQ